MVFEDIIWMDIRQLDEADTEKACYEKLSTFRKEKADQFRMAADRKRSIAAGWLLERQFRKKYPAAPLDIEYECSSNGKPHIVGFEDFHFSISHCKTHAVCITSDFDIGIDVESIGDDKRNMDRILRSRYFREDVKQWVQAENERKEIRFLLVWTLAEALTKAADMPLLSVLSKMDIKMLSEEFEFEFIFNGSKWHGFRQSANGCVVTVVYVDDRTDMQ